MIAKSITLALLACSTLAMAENASSPKGMIKQDDILRARGNLQRHEWAREYLNSLKAKVDPWADKISPEFVQRFIPQTTPLGRWTTPCVSCRANELPYIPHGHWSWSPERPEELLCLRCNEVFPSEKFPETVVLKSTWGTPQTFTFAGGEPFHIFTYPQGRPTYSGNIRAHKIYWATELTRNLAEAYTLTEDPRYAEATKALLLRFAEVYPHWLVHSGYGEFADMEPALAAKQINTLPKEELVCPPNTPDRVLHEGFWAAGRATGEGMEGVFIRNVATAYDLTRNARRANASSVYSKEEQALIEKDLLKEGTTLLVADPSNNNKSMANSCAAGLVGLITEDPELVRFGMRGFLQTVNEWFLPDGATPESPAYALMALDGIVDFAQALRGYSDPEGYRDSKGNRYDRFDPYRDTSYNKVWEAMFLTLQGDLHYPPFADSYRDSAMHMQLAEIMANNYPENAQYTAMLKALLGGDWSKVSAPHAIYLAEPDRTDKPVPELRLPDHLFPALAMGLLRTGSDGRESLLLLSATDWGYHHHLDSLNLYYWKQGEELLSDLGYLWDHPEQEVTTRTLCHNTVVIDGQDQTTSGRGGQFAYFFTTPHVKAMRASSTAYPNAKTYDRSVTLVDHQASNSYVVDVFRVEGGSTQDYIYHGPNQEWKFLAEPIGRGEPHALVPAKTADLYNLTDLKQLNRTDQTVHKLRWQLPSQRAFTIWHLAAPSETLFVGNGWGQRDWRNADRGVTLPYIVRRTEGAGRKCFVSVMEGHSSEAPFVKAIQRLSGNSLPEQVVALQIETSKGKDYIILNDEARKIEISTPDGLLSTQAKVAVLSVQRGKVDFFAVDSGTLQFRGEDLTKD